MFYPLPFIFLPYRSAGLTLSFNVKFSTEQRVVTYDRANNFRNLT